MQKIPVFWGNREWFQEGDSIIKGDALPSGDPKWVDYQGVTGDTSDLLKPSHPDSVFRELLKKQIKKDLLKDVDQFKRKPPVCVLTHGGIASGKTSAVDLMLDLPAYKGHYVRIDFDRVKLLLPEYEFMMTSGMKDAASFVHVESAKIAGAVALKCIEREVNLVYEGSLVVTDIIKQKIRKMRKLGYFIHLVSTYVPVAVGQARAVKRHEKGGRFVPPEKVAETYSKCPKTLVELKGLVDTLNLVYNGFEEKPAARILEVAKGVVQVLDSKLYDQYLLEVGAENRL